MAMVKSVFSILLVLGLSSSGLRAQEVWKEHILKTSRLDEWTVSKISRQLSGLNGIRFVGYCRKASCLFVKYDPAAVRSVKVIRGLILGAHSPLRLTEVKGYTFYDVIDGALEAGNRKTRLTASVNDQL